MSTLSTNAEKLAEKAESLPAFSGLKLAHVKQQLAKLLAMIGRDGVFDEYTSHDISHIDKMLSTLDWIVPEDTKAIMSSADWLLTVLAIYFHDLGMLVTKREYEQRSQSGFGEFRDKDLFGGANGKDYRVKVDKLGPDRSERFVYQEFVRAKHAERIRAWILGVERHRLGMTDDILAELDKLLAPLSPQFRRDLAIVCESHHLNDLDDFKKYKASQPYGDSDEETANVQYAAALMRTADLLHVTSDRTPSISFRVINPTDPISQEEWAKQMAVRRVRPQVGHDKEGNPDENAPRDTVEVHADFKKVDGFFGLTSYLLYAGDQLQKTHQWVVDASKTQGAKHRFPWRYIDDSHIETEGFIKETFEFTFDQARILDLLTGHTLYDDIKIVLRELVQNSIDAVRLQFLIDTKSKTTASMGSVTVRWNSKSRTLSVNDNGTGMTQNIIERNLLKVGSSRYQGEEFKQEFPDFSSISRFGIGVLSTFMIADSVEIVTSHPEEDTARQLSLRSVHGKYLIRLLDKHKDETAKALSPHGTKIELKIRHSVDMSDVIDTARRWIVIPRCPVSVIIDDEPPVAIGFSSPKAAVESYLLSSDAAMVDTDGNTRIKIVEETKNGVTLAYAVSWSEYFKEWSFLPVFGRSDKTEPLLGTCLEGIRVEFNTPGFEQYNIVAIANAEGPSAPKTNVARSGLEATAERGKMLNSLYSMFCRHVAREIDELHRERAFSLTWAVQESKYLLQLLLNSRSRPISLDRLYDETKKLPILLVEREGSRRAVSPADFATEPRFWTIDCASFRSAEELLREMPGDGSLSSLFSSLDSDPPQTPLLCGDSMDRISSQFVYAEKEVVSIEVQREKRRIDLEWGPQDSPPRWYSFPTDLDEPRRRLGRIAGSDIWRFRVCRGDVKVRGITDEIGVEAFGIRYLFPGSPIANTLLTLLSRMVSNPHSTQFTHDALFGFIMTTLFLRQEIVPINSDELRNYAARLSLQPSEESFSPAFVQLVNNTNWTVFDPAKWVRTPGDNEYGFGQEE